MSGKFDTLRTIFSLTTSLIQTFSTFARLFERQRFLDVGLADVGR